VRCRTTLNRLPGASGRDSCILAKRAYAGCVNILSYEWCAGDAQHQLRLVQVPGTKGKPYLFGADPNRRSVEVQNFHITTTPVTQALWMHVMGSNPSVRSDPRCPVENVSWDQITASDGFLERINSSKILAAVAGADRASRFRLPSETEWEYAARGGPTLG
jgi:formylglycine-generating enzyme required for sulfatase activity